MGRVLGIDFGERRVGLAVSDPSETIATPLPTLNRRKGKRPPVAPLVRLAQEHQVTAIVVGLPLTLDGEESGWTREVRAFAEALAQRSGLPVHFVDERLTSVRAERTVRTGMGLRRREREQKGRVDQAAAVLILQAWLDRRRGAAESAPGEP